MTMKEMIELLSTFPSDALAAYQAFSEIQDFHPEDLTLAIPSDGNSPKGGYIRHHGNLIHLDPTWWPERFGEKPVDPEYLTVVVFPGN